MSEKPLIKQYKEIKDRYPNEILFFRLGEFYEMFYDDAIIASKVLGIVLTSRNKEKDEDVPLAGVPRHRADEYVAKLIGAGYKVAICEQLEDPKNSKGIVKRDVVKVVTPGTVIDVENLDSKSNNYLVCINIAEDKAYISYVDITTSVFNAIIIDISKLQSQLYLIDPKEIVITKSNLQKIEPYLDPNNTISISLVDKPKNANKILTDYFEITSLDSFGLEDKNLIISCATLLDYLLETQVNLELNIPKISIIKNNEFAEINVTSMKNLEILKNSRDKSSYGTLLWILDKCKTSMGSRLLKEYLAQPLLNKEKIIKRQKDLSYLIENMLLREDLREELSNTYDVERIYSKLVFGNENARDLRFLAETFKKYIKIINLWEDKFKEEDTQVLNKIIQLVDESIVKEPPLTVREASMILPNYDSETKELNEILHDGKRFLIEIEQKEKEKTKINNLKIKYNKIFGYFIEISNSNKYQVPEEYIRKQTLSNCERFITEELKDYEDKILNARTRLNEYEYMILKEISKKILEYKDSVYNITKKIAYIDVISSFADVSLSNSYVKPNFNDNNEIQIYDGRHPVVEKLINSQFIENDTIFKKDKNFIILTGPNMAGKSTYMKQIALICILAQIGMYVPASSANLCIIDKFLTRIGASDDIITGQSTFMLEMSEVSNILNSATKDSLIILDEVGRGTSTYDGLSIASSISSYIHDKIGAKTIFATHYHELNELETRYDNMVNYRVEVEEKNNKVIFLRKISLGSADKSYGNYVAKLAGLPREVLRESQKILDKLEKRHILIQKTENIGQLSLFDNPRYLEETSDEEDYEMLKELKEEIEDIDLNNLTPLKALNLLQELKERIKNDR